MGEDAVEIPFGVFATINYDSKIMILQSLDYRDLIHLCSTGGSFSEFCRTHSKRIWKGMIKRDFDMTIIGDRNYLDIYKDLLIAEDYYKKHEKDSIWELIKNEDENYFGVWWLIQIKNIDPAHDENKAIGWASNNDHIEVVKLLLTNKK